MEKTYLYELIDPFSMDIRYVGVTKNPSERLGMHCCDKNNTHKYNWARKCIRLGKKPILKVVAISDRKTVLEYEKRYIKMLKDKGIKLFNISNGGDGNNLTGANNPASCACDLYDNGVFVKTFPTIISCAEYLGTSRGNIKSSKNRKHIFNKRYQVMNSGEKYVDYTHDPKSVKKGIFYEINGISKNIKQWSDYYGICSKTVIYRMKYCNMSIEDALTKPKKKGREPWK